MWVQSRTPGGSFMLLRFLQEIIDERRLSYETTISKVEFGTAARVDFLYILNGSTRRVVPPLELMILKGDPLLIRGTDI